MADDVLASESEEGIGALSPELRELEDRFLADSVVWATDLDAFGEGVAAFARTLPNDASTSTAANDGKITAAPAANLPHAHVSKAAVSPKSHTSTFVAGTAAFLVVALLALVVSVFAHGRVSGTASAPTVTTGTQQEPTVTTGAQPEPTSAATSGPRATGTPTSTAGGSTGPVATQPATAKPLEVTTVSLAVDHSSYSGVCTNVVPFVFTMTINVAASASGGTVAYQWLDSGGSVAGPASVAFAPGETSHTVSYTLQVPAQSGDGSSRWLAGQATSSNSVTSSRADYALTCVSAITQVIGSVMPSSWTGTCSGSQDVSFTFTATVSQSPNVPNTLNWSESDNFPPGRLWYPPSGTAPVLTSTNGGPEGTLSQAVYGSDRQLDVSVPNATYWVKVTFTGPNNSIMTQTEAITKSCS